MLRSHWKDNLSSYLNSTWKYVLSNKHLSFEGIFVLKYKIYICISCSFDYGRKWWLIHSSSFYPSNKPLCVKVGIDMRLFRDPITMDYAFGWARKTKTEKRGHYYHAQSCVMEKKVLFFTYDTLKQERHKPYFKEYFKSISELEVQFVLLKLRLIEYIYVFKKENKSFLFCWKRERPNFIKIQRIYT